MKGNQVHSADDIQEAVTYRAEWIARSHADSVIGTSILAHKAWRKAYEQEYNRVLPLSITREQAIAKLDKLKTVNLNYVSAYQVNKQKAQQNANDITRKQKIKMGNIIIFMKSQEWQNLRQKVFARDGYKCANKYCQFDAKIEGLVYHVDHIEPKSERSELMKEMSNLQVLCEHCNVAKGTKSNSVWMRDQYGAFA
jgi:5-methylcytosine-specific restriction endonuclease McrA